MSDEIPHSVWRGSFRLLGLDIRCHVLSDGRRVVESDSFQGLLDAMADEFPSAVDADEMERFAKWLRGGFDA